MRRFAVEGVKEQIVAASRPALRVIAIAVAAVMMIVCANVANLVLARGTGRQREIAVRLAIGASRGRVIRQFAYGGSVVLAAIGGGVLGTLVAVRHRPDAGAKLATRRTHRASSTWSGVPVVMPARSARVGVDRPPARLRRWALGRHRARRAARCRPFRMRPAQPDLHLVDDRARGRAAPAVPTPASAGVLVVAQMVVATMLLVGAGLLGADAFTRLTQDDPRWNDSGACVRFYLVLPEQDTLRRRKGR